MNVLIIKLGATGDVVRTTPLLHRLKGSVTWITAAKNAVFLEGLTDNLRHFPWEARATSLGYFLRPRHKSGRHPRGCPISEECQINRDLRRLCRFIRELVLHRQLEVLV